MHAGARVLEFLPQQYVLAEQGPEPEQAHESGRRSADRQVRRLPPWRLRLREVERCATGLQQLQARLSALRQLQCLQECRIGAAPVLEIASAFGRQLALEIAVDELMVLDELRVEARCRLCIDRCNGVRIHDDSISCRVWLTQYVK